MKKLIIFMFVMCSALSLFAQGGKEINVISREEGSGTRGAFVELTGVEEKIDGVKVDQTTQSAEIANSTSVVITSVQGNKNAIGYISLGSLSDKVKALVIDGVAPSVETVKNGKYKIARPFNIAYKELSPLAADFVSYILSSEGQEVIVSKGYVSVGNNGAYEKKNLSGRITISGSSSVYPAMEKLVEKYLEFNTGVEITLLQSDSTTGVNDAASGTSDIGMASRELKASELEKGLQASVIAMDGIAVIVNNENEVNELTASQVKDIYIGKTTSWSNL